MLFFNKYWTPYKIQSVVNECQQDLYASKGVS